MGCKVLCPSVALLASLMICQHVQAQCTYPYFESQNVRTIEPPSRYPDGSTVEFECLMGHRPVDSKASISSTCRGTQWTRLELSCTKHPQTEIGNEDAEVQPSTSQSTYTPSQALILAVNDVAAGLREINKSMNKLIALLGSQRSA